MLGLYMCVAAAKALPTLGQRAAAHAANALTTHLDANFLPVNALSGPLLREEILAAAPIKTAICWRGVDALRKAHVVFATASAACEAHALNQWLDCTDPDHCALDTHNLACKFAQPMQNYGIA